MFSTDELLSRFALGPDSEWALKELRFEGDCLMRPNQWEIADEMAALANGDGGTVVFGVTDQGGIQDMTRRQSDALGRVVVEAAAQCIVPPLAVDAHRRKLGEKSVMVVAVPRGHAQHDSPGGSYYRIGSSKIKMSGDQRLRLAQERAMSRFAGFDKSAVPDTGLRSLDEALWKKLVSVHGARAPNVALEKMGLLTRDERGTPRASVAGLLLCARAPDEWLDNACIMTTCYRGTDRAAMQLDAETICGPLDRQIAAAVAFVLRNMRVAARKDPGRVDLPQFSDRAVFEAVVNAVVHRDYSMRGRRIRVSLFEDRLEIQSPGALANGLRIDTMEARQATRNGVLASALGRMSAEKVTGSGDRRFFMARRGAGVGIIRRETEALGAGSPVHELVGDADLLLTIPAAPLGWTPGRVALRVRSADRSVVQADILLLYPDGSYVRATSNDEGAAAADLHSTHLPMTVFAAAPGFAAYLRPKWVPAQNDRSLAIELEQLPDGGSAIFADGFGQVPGLRATLNPIRDAHDRTQLYVSGATVNEGAEQPVPTVPYERLQLTDAVGRGMAIRIPAVVGKSTIVEYR